MAMADPKKVKVDGSTEVDLPRVSTGDRHSEYQSADGLIEAIVSTENGKRKRHMSRINLSKLTESPTFTGQKEEVSASAYLVVDRPITGFTTTELVNLVSGLITDLTASTNTNLKKLVQEES